MSENLVEKKFLYLVAFSLLLHGAIFTLLLQMPEEKKSPATDPLMVDLEGIPAYVPPKSVTPPVERHAAEQRRVEREVAPRGESLRDRAAPAQAPMANQPSVPVPEARKESTSATRQPVLPEGAAKDRSPAEGLFRKRRDVRTPDAATLFPGADRMARLEESYRKKYGPEVAEGETRFLNTDDIQFGSFLRRFENSVYGVWRYPAEAAKLGIEGITPVRITFNRRGEIVGREILQSSGSRILDNEVLRTLDKIGPVGSFPRGYDRDTFNLIAFFHYGIMQGWNRPNSLR